MEVDENSKDSATGENLPNLLIGNDDAIMSIYSP
jgi:hypothetical protein